MTDQELKDLIASLAIGNKELKESQQKTDEQLNELKESQQKTDEQLKATDEQLQKSGEAFDKRMAKLEKKLNKIGTMLGGISNNQGDVAEEYFVNSLKDKLQIANIHFDYLIPNYIIKGKNIKDEYDILLVNGKSVAIIEVKYKVHPNDLKKLPKKIANLKKLPQYKKYKVYAGVAGFKIPDSVLKEAKKEGFFVLQRKGDIVQTYADNLKVA